MAGTIEMVRKFIVMIFIILLSINLLACGIQDTEVHQNVTASPPIAAGTITTSSPNISKWTDKNYAGIGDSITYFDGKKYPNTNTLVKGYQTLLNDKIHFKEIINDGKDGASMAKSTAYPTNDSIALKYASKDYSDKDIVTIFAGTNDFKLDVPMGVIGKKEDKRFDVSTFYGSYRKLLESILKQNASIKVYLFTPLQRDHKGYDIVKVNAAGFRLIDYADAIKKLGQRYNLPVLDLYAVSGINISNLKQYTWDGLHPNNNGYKLIVKAIADFIEKN